MIQATFSIEDNYNIKKFLNNEGEYVPYREIQYLHTHPLITPNFIIEIANLVDITSCKIEAKKHQR